MGVKFQLLDCDYIIVDNKPKVRIFGRADNGKTVCVYYSDFYPYFYILPKDNKDEKVIEFLKNNYKNLIKNIEYIEKYLPIGYEEKKRRLIKVTLYIPSKVASLREELRKNRFVEETFEADILFKYRFMADLNLLALHTYEAFGHFTTTNSVNTNLIIEAEKFKEVDVEVPLKYLSIDIEIASKEGVPDSKKHEIIMIGLSFSPKYKGRKNLVLLTKPIRRNKEIICFRNEKEMLENLIKIINGFDPDFITGYNINNFDLPYIIDRMRINKIFPAFGRAKDKGANSRQFGAKKKNKIPGRIVVDVYEILKEFASKGSLRLKRYGLGDVAKVLIGETKVDVSHSEIYKLWNGSEKDLERLVEYTRKDAELVLKILLEKNLLDKFFELSRVSGLLLQDILDMGEAARIENLLLREFNKRDFVIPNKPTNEEYKKREAEREVKALKGALVLEPKTGFHKNIIYLDFKAMYPSILISYNICPTTYLPNGSKKIKDKDIIVTPYGSKFVSKKIREGIFPQILSKLIEERDKVKKQMKACKDEWKKKMLDTKQWGLKYMTNAFYGYTGYTRARFYILNIANAITSCGREIIKKTKETVEKTKKYSVVYGDTDSVMVKVDCKDMEEAFKKGKEIEKFVNEAMKGIVRIKIEGIFKSLLILSKKRYAGLAVEKEDSGYKEQMVMKGIETVRRDWCELTSKVLYDVLNIVLKEQKPAKAFGYVKEILRKLEKNEIPIEDLVITKSISKPIKEYKGVQPHIELVKRMRKRDVNAPGVGDRVGYVIIAGPQLVSQRAEDPEYVKKHNLKIDAKYYIESQILPPLERVFEVLGVSRSQLIGIGRQLLLGEITNKVKKKEVVLKDFEGFVCNNCNTFYRRIPLNGKCSRCNGEVLFYHKGEKSKQLVLS